MEIPIMKNILAANEEIAKENEAWFAERKVFTVNLMASPGAGKTSFILKTIEALREEMNIGVIEGDIASSVDAEKISQVGIPAIQINTNRDCHLEAWMIKKALPGLADKELDLLIIENVGNLVCPAEFKIGEATRVVILSVAEGHDKPLKYPMIFSEADVLIINKIDLLEMTDFDIAEVRKITLGMNPDLTIFETSSKTGAGFDNWYEWVRTRVTQLQSD